MNIQRPAVLFISLLDVQHLGTTLRKRGVR